MRTRRLPMIAAAALTALALQTAPAPSLAAEAPAAPSAAGVPAGAREGWFPARVDSAFMKAQVAIPPKKGVTIVDSRPAARQYDPGHIPGAISIPDSQFDKLVDRLPADRQSLLVFYCGGLECMLSHQSAFKAQRLGYADVRVYAEGMPAWIAQGGTIAVSAAHIRKLIDEKAAYALVDARPRRTADKGMIPTAVSIPDSEFDKHVALLPADKATPLIYYCGGLECVLSDQSAEKARKLGYTRVMTYPEGFPEWQRLFGGGEAAGTGAPARAAPSAVAALEPGREKGSVTFASFKETWKAAPASLLLVDVREPREYAAGSIAGAVNVPIGQLEKQLATLPADKPVVFFCGTGARAGEAYDTVKLLRGDVDARFLDVPLKFEGDGTFALNEKK